MNTYLVYSSYYQKHLVPLEDVEIPDRVKVIQEKLAPLKLQVLSPRKATNEDLLRCHRQDYLDLVDEDILDVTRRGMRDDEFMTLSTGYTAICPESKEVALLAAGGVLTAVDAVMDNIARNVFCNVRPPGHHATPDKGMGFCIFNNVAIGVRYAQAVHGVKKILIVDWDVHHGNGTEEIFQDDPNVFYFSTHQKGIFPGTGEDGNGDYPIEKSDNARDEILEIFRHTLPKIAEEFSPDLVFISAGFDAREGDPLGGLNLTDSDFAELTRIVKSISNGGIISVLEGGYDLDGLGKAVYAHVKTLMEV